MPNWVVNEIVSKQTKEICSKCIDDDGNFDFEKLMPQPKELNIEAGGFEWVTSKWSYYSDDKLCYENTTLKPILDVLYTNEISQDDFVSVVNATLKAANILDKAHEVWKFNTEHHTDKDFDNIWKGYFNFRRYGNTNWYTWCCDNWGTKWNANDTYTDNESYLNFRTAWCTPEGVWQELAKEFDFIVLYADEGISENSGVVIAEDGEATIINVLDEIDDYAAMYFKELVWGASPEDFDDEEIYDYLPKNEEALKSALYLYNTYINYYKNN